MSIKAKELALFNGSSAVKRGGISSFPPAQPLPVSRIKIEVVAGVEGECLLINGYRVAGPKPWGGGSITKTWAIDEARFHADLVRAFPNRPNK